MFTGRIVWYILHAKVRIEGLGKVLNWNSNSKLTSSSEAMSHGKCHLMSFDGFIGVI